MYSTGGPSRHAILRLPAGENRVQVVQRPETHGIAGLPGSAADCRASSSMRAPRARIRRSPSTAPGNLRVTTTFGFEPMNVYCSESSRQSKQKRPLQWVVIKRLSARSISRSGMLPTDSKLVRGQYDALDSLPTRWHHRLRYDRK